MISAFLLPTLPSPAFFFGGPKPPTPQRASCRCMSISKFNLRSMVSCVPGAKRVAKSVEDPFVEGTAVYIYVAYNSALAA